MQTHYFFWLCFQRHSKHKQNLFGIRCETQKHISTEFSQQSATFFYIFVRFSSLWSRRQCLHNWIFMQRPKWYIWIETIKNKADKFHHSLSLQMDLQWNEKQIQFLWWYKNRWRENHRLEMDAIWKRKNTTIKLHEVMRKEFNANWRDK